MSRNLLDSRRPWPVCLRVSVSVCLRVNVPVCLRILCNSGGFLVRWAGPLPPCCYLYGMREKGKQTKVERPSISV